MAGLDPGIHLFPFSSVFAWMAGSSPGHDGEMFAGVEFSLYAGINPAMYGGWVYIVTNRPNGTLYLGVTSNLAGRIRQHREGVVDGFIRRYGLKTLVWFEGHDTIEAAIQREKTMKHWPRAWKARLILSVNPVWADLYESIV